MSLPDLKKIAREYWPLAALLAAGLLLRLPSPEGITHYLTPQEFQRDLAVLKEMDSGRLLLIGPPSIFNGFRFGPLYYYLHYPLASLGGFKEYSLALTSLCFSLLTVVLTFLTAQRWFKDRKTAFLAAGLLTFSILDISFAKYGSSPNTVPFFTLFFFYQLEKFLAGKGGIADAALLGLAWAAAAQLHGIPLLSLTLVVSAAIFLTKARPRAGRLLAIFAAAALLYSPYLYYQFTHGFSDIGALAGALGTEPSFMTYPERFAELASFALALVVRYKYLFNADLMSGMILLLANTLAVSLVWVVEKDRRRRPVPTPAVLAPSVRMTLILWLAAPALVLLLPISRVNVMPYHYFIMLIPVGYLLLALGLDRLKRHGLRYTAGAILASYGLWQAAQIIQYHLEYPSVLTAWLAGR